MKFMRIIIIGIVIFTISGIYIIQVTQNQQIDEILVTSENKGMCDESIDKNRNQIPDEFEKSSVRISIDEKENIDYSYCIFPNKVTDFIFKNSNFEGADFSNTEIKNVMFAVSNLNGVNFSNSSLHGVIFAYSSINESNFTNADFYPNPWKNPYTMVHNKENTDKFTCYTIPCSLVGFEAMESSLNYDMLSKGSEEYLNFRFADAINDKSDRRELYRHVTNFYVSKLINSTFTNADLSYVIFHATDLSNSVIETSNISNMILDKTIVKNTKINDEYYIEEIKNEIMDQDDNWKQMIYDEVN